MPSSPPANRALGSGLTLWEAMVGVLALVVIAAVMMPAFTSYDDRHMKTPCLSNLKQLAVAMLIYQEDVEGRFPSGPWASPGGGWGYAIRPYVGNPAIYRDPAVKATASKPPLAEVTYGLNSNLGGTDLQQGTYRASRLPVVVGTMARPDATVVFFEVSNAVAELSDKHGRDEFPTGNTVGGPLFAGLANVAASYPAGTPADMAAGPVRYATGDIGGRRLNGGLDAETRHRGLANYSYADGHARTMEPRRVSGGIDAVDAKCGQGTISIRNPRCAAQRPWSAAGTANPGFRATFSVR